MIRKGGVIGLLWNTPHSNGGEFGV